MCDITLTCLLIPFVEIRWERAILFSLVSSLCSSKYVQTICPFCAGRWRVQCSNSWMFIWYVRVYIAHLSSGADAPYGSNIKLQCPLTYLSSESLSEFVEVRELLKGTKRDKLYGYEPCFWGASFVSPLYGIKLILLYLKIWLCIIRRRRLTHLPPNLLFSGRCHFPCGE